MRGSNLVRATSNQSLCFIQRLFLFCNDSKNNFVIFIMQIIILQLQCIHQAFVVPVPVIPGSLIGTVLETGPGKLSL